MSPEPPGGDGGLRLRLLGAVQASSAHGVLARWPSRHAALLLARLALWPDRHHPREELVELLWPGVAPDVGRNRLRQCLSSLREALRAVGAADLIIADRHALRVAPGQLSSDVRELHLALRDGRRDRVQALDQGELLPGHFDEWVIDERRALAAQLERLAARTPLRGTVIEARLTHTLPVYLTRRHGFDELLAQLQRAALAHRLVVARGPGGAGKTRLAVEVAHRLQASADAGFAAVVFVPLVACETRHAMREAILAAVQPHGDSAASSARDPRERVHAALLGRRVLLVLDNFEQLVLDAQDDLAWLLAHLPELHLLVTSRHLLGLDGEWEVPVTTLALPPPRASLEVCAANPAVALFVDRARAANADFVLGHGNHELVAAIVAQLGGLPLAIELAASRLRSLSLADMLALLQSATGDAPAAAPAAGNMPAVQDAPPALAMLARSGARSGDDARHASMLAVVQWSLARLRTAERELLCALTVFDGGATLQAAAAVVAQPELHTALAMDELVGSSVVYLVTHGAAPARYHVYEPVRDLLRWQTSAETLAALRERHLTWTARWVHALGREPSLPGVADELANLGTAWRHAARRGDAGAHAIAAMAIGLQHALDDLTLSAEALHHLDDAAAALEAAGPDSRFFAARLRGLLALQHFDRGERDAASRQAMLAERALDALPTDTSAAARPADAHALVLHAVARIRLRVHNDPGCERLVERGLALLQTGAGEIDAAHAHAQARLLSIASVLAIRLHADPALKLERDRHALLLWRAHGPAPRVTEGLVNVALALGFLHRVDEQLQLLHEAHACATRHGQTRLLAFVCSVRGYALADLQRWDEAAASYRECLRLSWAHGAWREWFYALWNLPRPLAHLREARAAAMLLAFADRFAAERFGELGASDLRERRRSRRLVRALVGSAAEAELWNAGRALDMAAAMAMAQGGGAADAADASIPEATKGKH